MLPVVQQYKNMFRSLLGAAFAGVENGYIGEDINKSKDVEQYIIDNREKVEKYIASLDTAALVASVDGGIEAKGGSHINTDLKDGHLSDADFTISDGETHKQAIEKIMQAVDLLKTPIAEGVPMDQLLEKVSTFVKEKDSTVLKAKDKKIALNASIKYPGLDSSSGSKQAMPPKETLVQYTRVHQKTLFPVIEILSTESLNSLLNPQISNAEFKAILRNPKNDAVKGYNEKGFKFDKKEIAEIKKYIAEVVEYRGNQTSIETVDINELKAIASNGVENNPFAELLNEVEESDISEASVNTTLSNSEEKVVVLKSEAPVVKKIVEIDSNSITQAKDTDNNNVVIVNLGEANQTGERLDLPHVDRQNTDVIIGNIQEEYPAINAKSLYEVTNELSTEDIYEILDNKHGVKNLTKSGYVKKGIYGGTEKSQVKKYLQQELLSRGGAEVYLAKLGYNKITQEFEERNTQEVMSKLQSSVLGFSGKERTRAELLKKYANLGSLTTLLKSADLPAVWEKIDTALESQKVETEDGEATAYKDRLLWNNYGKVTKVLKTAGYDVRGRAGHKEISTVVATIRDQLDTQSKIDSYSTKEKFELLMDIDGNGRLETDLNFNAGELQLDFHAFDSRTSDGVDTLMKQLGLGSLSEFEGEMKENLFVAREKFQRVLATSLKRGIKLGELFREGGVEKATERMYDAREVVQTKVYDLIDEKFESKLSQYTNEEQKELLDKIKLEAVGILISGNPVDGNKGIGASFDVSELKLFVDSIQLGATTDGKIGISVTKRLFNKDGFTGSVSLVNIVFPVLSAAWTSEAKVDTKDVFDGKIKGEYTYSVYGTVGGLKNISGAVGFSVSKSMEANIEAENKTLGQMLDAAKADIKAGKSFAESAWKDNSGEHTEELYTELLNSFKAYAEGGEFEDQFLYDMMAGYKEYHADDLYRKAQDKGFKFTSAGVGIAFISGYLPLPFITLGAEKVSVEYAQSLHSLERERDITKTTKTLQEMGFEAVRYGAEDHLVYKLPDAHNFSVSSFENQPVQLERDEAGNIYLSGDLDSIGIAEHSTNRGVLYTIVVNGGEVENGVYKSTSNEVAITQSAEIDGKKMLKRGQDIVTSVDEYKVDISADKEMRNTQPVRDLIGKLIHPEKFDASGKRILNHAVDHKHTIGMTALQQAIYKFNRDGEGSVDQIWGQLVSMVNFDGTDSKGRPRKFASYISEVGESKREGEPYYGGSESKDEARESALADLETLRNILKEFSSASDVEKILIFQSISNNLMEKPILYNSDKDGEVGPNGEILKDNDYEVHAKLEFSTLRYDTQEKQYYTVSPNDKRTYINVAYDTPNGPKRNKDGEIIIINSDGKKENLKVNFKPGDAITIAQYDAYSMVFKKEDTLPEGKKVGDWKSRHTFFNERFGLEDEFGGENSIMKEMMIAQATWDEKNGNQKEYEFHSIADGSVAFTGVFTGGSKIDGVMPYSRAYNVAKTSDNPEDYFIPLFPDSKPTVGQIRKVLDRTPDATFLSYKNIFETHFDENNVNFEGLTDAEAINIIKDGIAKGHLELGQGDKKVILAINVDLSYTRMSECLNDAIVLRNFNVYQTNVTTTAEQLNNFEGTAVTSSTVNDAKHDVVNYGAAVAGERKRKGGNGEEEHDSDSVAGGDEAPDIEEGGHTGDSTDGGLTTSNTTRPGSSTPLTPDQTGQISTPDENNFL